MDQAHGVRRYLPDRPGTSSRQRKSPSGQSELKTGAIASCVAMIPCCVLRYFRLAKTEILQDNSDDDDQTDDINNAVHDALLGLLNWSRSVAHNDRRRSGNLTLTSFSVASYPASSDPEEPSATALRALSKPMSFAIEDDLSAPCVQDKDQASTARCLYCCKRKHSGASAVHRNNFAIPLRPYCSALV